MSKVLSAFPFYRRGNWGTVALMKLLISERDFFCRCYLSTFSKLCVKGYCAFRFNGGKNSTSILCLKTHTHTKVLEFSKIKICHILFHLFPVLWGICTVFVRKAKWTHCTPLVLWFSALSSSTVLIASESRTIRKELEESTKTSVMQF